MIEPLDKDTGIELGSQFQKGSNSSSHPAQANRKKQFKLRKEKENIKGQALRKNQDEPDSSDSLQKSIQQIHMRGSQIVQKQIDLIEIQSELQRNGKSSLRNDKVIAKSSERKIVKKEQYLSLFLINIVLTFICFSFTPVALFGGGFSSSKDKFLAYTAIATTVGFTFNTWMMSQGFKSSVLLYTLLDPMLVSLIAACLGYTGLINIAFSVFTENWENTVMKYGFNPMNFIFVGNFRVLLTYRRLSRCKTLVLKGCFLGGAIMYFLIGAYVMFFNFKFTGGAMPELDSKMKDFVLLFTFGCFSMVCGMYSKLSDLDGTTNLLPDYTINKDQEPLPEEKLDEDEISRLL